MVVEIAFKDQNTRKFVFFHMLIFNLLCHMCELSYRVKSGQSMHHHAKNFVGTNPRHYSVL